MSVIMFASSSGLLALLGVDLPDFLNANLFFSPIPSPAPLDVSFPLSLLSLRCVTASIGVPLLVGAGTLAPSPKYLNRLFFLSFFDFLALSCSLSLVCFVFGVTSVILFLPGMPILLSLFWAAFPPLEYIFCPAASVFWSG